MPRRAAAKSKHSKKQHSRVKLHAILGKSPGETLAREGRSAYGLEAQMQNCIVHFNNQFGKDGWEVVAWHHRDISARISKKWIQELGAICAQCKNEGATLAASSACRLLRNRRNIPVIENTGVSFLMCDNENIDRRTANGRHQLAAAVDDSHLKAELCSDRVKAALKLAKQRGQKLGSNQATGG